MNDFAEVNTLNTALAKLDEARLGFEVLQELLALAPPGFEVNANNLGHLLASLNRQLHQCCLALDTYAPVAPAPNASPAVQD